MVHSGRDVTCTRWVEKQQVLRSYGIHVWAALIMVSLGFSSLPRSAVSTEKPIKMTVTRGWQWSLSRPSPQEVITAAVVHLRQLMKEKTPPAPAVRCQHFLLPDAVLAHQIDEQNWWVQLPVAHRCRNIPTEPPELRFVTYVIRLCLTPSRSLSRPFGLMVTKVTVISADEHARPTEPLSSTLSTGEHHP